MLMALFPLSTEMLTFVIPSDICFKIKKYAQAIVHWETFNLSMHTALVSGYLSTCDTCGLKGFHYLCGQPVRARHMLGPDAKSLTNFCFKCASLNHQFRILYTQPYAYHHRPATIARLTAYQHPCLSICAYPSNALSAEEHAKCMHLLSSDFD